MDPGSLETVIEDLAAFLMPQARKVAEFSDE